MAKSMEPYRREGRAGWYVDLGNVKLPDGSRRRYRGLKCEGRSKEQARDWAYQERTRVASDGHRRQRKEEAPTVDDLFPRYLERAEKIGGRRGKAGPHWIARLQVAYCGTNGNAGWLRPRFGRLPVNRINARSLETLVMDMHDAGRSEKTIAHTLQAMRGILDVARRHGHIEEVPEFPIVRGRRPARTAYRFEEAEKALQVARSKSEPVAYAFLLLGFHAGLYQEEIMGLERNDVDFDTGCLHIRRSATDSGHTKPPKTENRVRDIPMTPQLESVMREHLRTVPVGVKFVFFRREGGKIRRLRKEWIRWPVRAALDRAGLPVEEPFRRMRRTFCTEAKQRVPEVLVTRWMGHADRNVTDRHYVADWPMEHQRELIALLEKPAQLHGRLVGARWEPVLVPGRGSAATAMS